MTRKKGAVRKDEGADKAPEVSADKAPEVSAEEPKPEVKAEEPKPEVKAKGYYVREGKSITSRKGILGPGTLVKAEYFGPGGDAVLVQLISSGRVEPR